MNVSDNSLTYLEFEEVKDSMEEHPDLPPMRQEATYMASYIGDGKSIEQVRVYFGVHANRTIADEVIETYIQELQVECHIEEDGKAKQEDIRPDESEQREEDGRSTSALPDQEASPTAPERDRTVSVESTVAVDDNPELNDSLVITIEIDKEDRKHLPESCRLSFQIDPTINTAPAPPHTYAFGNTADVTAIVRVTRGRARVDLVGGGGSRVVSAANQPATLRSAVHRPQLIVTGEQDDSYYTVSGSREIL
jgi:hypothetical protein